MLVIRNSDILFIANVVQCLLTIFTLQFGIMDFFIISAANKTLFCISQINQGELPNICSVSFLQKVTCFLIIPKIKRTANLSKKIKQI